MLGVICKFVWRVGVTVRHNMHVLGVICKFVWWVGARSNMQVCVVGGC